MKAKRCPSKTKYLSVLSQECLNAGVSIAAVLDGGMDRLRVIPRHKTWKRLAAEGYGLAGIAFVAGVRDHTTVLNGVRSAGRYDDWLAKRRESEAMSPTAVPKIRAAGCTVDQWRSA